MTRSSIPAAFLEYAQRNLPRYTSYPTAVAFHDHVGEADARSWVAAAEGPLSLYVHIPFCDQLCWYCGCNTTVPNGYGRIARYLETLHQEIDLWAAALGKPPHTAHLHFGGGSPNALSADDFEALVTHLRSAFGVEADAEVAVELDPRSLDRDFLAALARSGVNRASLGVQTFDPIVQAKINRIQPFDQIAEGVAGLRRAGVTGVNFDLIYGRPGQDEASMWRTAALAAELRPDRVSVFGYAHVPWFAKHQKMIRTEDLAGPHGRWSQAEAADAVLISAGYQRIGLDHYALPGDSLCQALLEGRLKRNFQGYTADAADTLIPLGVSAIGAFAQGFVQAARTTDAWAAAVQGGHLPIQRGVATSAEDRLRAAVIERLMCDLEVDVGALCRAFGYSESWLDPALAGLSALQADGLCHRQGRRVRVGADARRLVRVVAAAFDAALSTETVRHAQAV